ncbi:MAG: hypothetical protein ABI876_08775 [Bacteroidota bacterium]
MLFNHLCRLRLGRRDSRGFHLRICGSLYHWLISFISFGWLLYFFLFGLLGGLFLGTYSLLMIGINLHPLLLNLAMLLLEFAHNNIVHLLSKRTGRLISDFESLAMEKLYDSLLANIKLGSDLE